MHGTPIRPLLDGMNRRWVIRSPAIPTGPAQPRGNRITRYVRNTRGVTRSPVPEGYWKRSIRRNLRKQFDLLTESILSK